MLLCNSLGIAITCLIVIYHLIGVKDEPQEYSLLNQAK